MKITIYKLLRLINDGKAPKKIKYDDIVLEYNEEIEDYNYYDGKGLFEYKFENCKNFLNDEVEIIDDEEWRTIFDFPNYEVSNKGNIRSKEYNDSLGHLRSSKKLKKIEMYQDEEGHYFLNKQDRKVYVNCDEMDFMVDKFNELIDEINNLKEK